MSAKAVREGTQQDVATTEIALSVAHENDI